MNRPWCGDRKLFINGYSTGHDVLNKKWTGSSIKIFRESLTQAVRPVVIPKLKVCKQNVAKVCKQNVAKVCKQNFINRVIRN